MRKHTSDDWVVLAPSFSHQGKAAKIFHNHAEALVAWNEEPSPDPVALRRITEISLRDAAVQAQATAATAAVNLLSDLAGQRWKLRVSENGTVEVCRPDAEHLDPRAEKDRIRAQELVKRDEQLKQPATQKFIKAMEWRRLHKGKFVSIFSLMRDGRQLAASLRLARDLPMPARPAALRKIIDPYIEFVTENATCHYTGLRLQDTWRYFRHTWSNQYTSTPGRTMSFLVRDRAAICHPVIGIGALGSPIVQIRERDAWIGWQPTDFCERVAASPSVELGRWLINTVDGAIEEIHVADFFEELHEGKRFLRSQDLANPNDEVIARLTAYGDTQRSLHHRLATSREFKGSHAQHAEGDSSKRWETRARSHLFRSKRAVTLAGMLQARMVLAASLGGDPSVEDVHRLATDRTGRRAIRQVLRQAKATRVGIALADITVCGAVPPYNSILGGKLVSMLAASPEVAIAYERRYAQAESEIASSIAARPIVRPSALVYIGTTSLYGVGSSQYNRVHVPASLLGGGKNDALKFLELGRSEAYGTSHFSEATVRSLVSLVQQSANGQRVNSIFGEGVSPKLRKIRDGLDQLNLPADVLLRHGRKRVVYGVPLIRNLREYLLGMDDTPDFLFSCPGAKATQLVSNWWIERWLSKRIDRDAALDDIAANTLVSPVRHGARVVLPKTNDQERQSVFEDLEW